MYKITYIDKKLCHLLKHHLDLLDDDDCDIYTIWQFCPRQRWRALKNIFNNKALCRAGYFPLIYWLVLIISILGCIHSFSEFTSVFWGNRKEMSMWRERKFYVLPSSVLRKCRLVGSLITLFDWLFLWYAVVKISPSYMTPWLTINMFVLSFELIIWLVEVFMGVCKIEMHNLLSFGLALANYWFVNCVQSVFQRAIELNTVDDLRLWRSSS
ncbi:hypothetical protein DOY81_012968 [Sarcophaga bullata]|nr:hypothetical protein DOY81_012968 [Sarcophaga bullata]